MRSVPVATSRCLLSLHDALPISPVFCTQARCSAGGRKLSWLALVLLIPSQTTPACFLARLLIVFSRAWRSEKGQFGFTHSRSEEHTSELQSQSNIVCRLLHEKKK